MALATYTDLKASVADFLHQSNMTSQIPDFIKLCETELNNLLSVRMMEQTDTLACVVSSRNIALPTGFLSPIDLWVAADTSSVRQWITPLGADNIPNNVSSAFPRAWTIDGSNILLDSPADVAYPAYFRYRKGFDLATDSTNWLLTNFPNVYLYGTLMQAAPYMLEDPRIQTWQMFYERGITILQRSDHKNKSPAILTTEIAQMRQSGYDIRRG